MLRKTNDRMPVGIKFKISLSYFYTLTHYEHCDKGNKIVFRPPWGIVYLYGLFVTNNNKNQVIFTFFVRCLLSLLGTVWETKNRKEGKENYYNLTAY